MNGQLHEHRALAAASQIREAQAREEADGLARALIESNRRADVAEARAAAVEESRGRDIRVREEDLSSELNFASMNVSYLSVGSYPSIMSSSVYTS